MGNKWNYDQQALILQDPEGGMKVEIRDMQYIIDHFSLLLGSGSTSDNLNKFAGNDGLASAVEENLEPGDHVSGVLGGILKQLSDTSHRKVPALNLRP